MNPAPPAAYEHLLSLIFSGPGATIVVCATLLIMLAVLVAIPHRLPAFNFGFKDYRFEIPPKTGAPSLDSAQLPTLPTDAPTIGASNKAEGDDKKNTETEKYAWVDKLVEATRNQDKQAIEKIFDDFRINPPFKDHTDIQREVWKHSELLRAGFLESIDELEKIEDERNRDFSASLALANYYLRLKAPGKAKAHIEKVSARAENDKDRGTALLLRARFTEQSAGADQAISLLISGLKSISESGALASVYQNIGKRFCDLDRNDAAIGAYEQAIRHDVHNQEERFQLAYLYSKHEKLHSLCVRHYRILLEQNQGHALARNNLGVAYETMGLPIHKINAWKEALDRGNNYALGNLVLSYLEEGFFDHAKELFNKAPEHVKDGSRVAYANDRLAKVQSEEKEKLEKALEATEKIWRAFSDVDFDITIDHDSIVGEWRSVSGQSTLNIQKSGEFLRIAQNDAPWQRTGLIKTLGGISVVSTESQRNTTSPTLSLLGMDKRDGALICLCFGQKLHAVYIEGDQLVSNIEYVKSPAPPAAT
jgi:tetratricopeptide (TPR) repeat protein